MRWASNKIFVIAAAMALVIVAAMIYAYFDPEEVKWFPRCPVYVVTGLKCPGCGSQRMLHALLTGDFAGAFRQNAFLLASLPLIAALIVAEPLRSRLPRIYTILYSDGVVITFLVAMGLWTILRNLFGW